MEEYVVNRVTKETPEVVTIFFSRSDGTYPDFMAGQFLTVQFPDLGVPEGKAYSLSSISGDEHMSITVKAIGPYSNRLCGLRKGDSFFGSQPYGFLFEDTGAPLVCVAAGVGISPVWSVIRSVLRTDRNRKIVLLYSNKTVDDIVFADDIYLASIEHRNFVVHHHITRQSNIEGNYRRARIGSEDIKSLGGESTESDYLLCGSEEFVVSMYRAIRSSGTPESRISTEIFF